MSDPEFDSAVLVPVPEAEPIRRGWWDRLTTEAWEGVPAHVTILALPADAVDEGVLSELASHFGKVEPFAFALTGVRAFPDTVWLAPQQAEPFIASPRACSRGTPTTRRTAGSTRSWFRTSRWLITPIHVQSASSSARCLFRSRAGPRRRG